MGPSASYWRSRREIGYQTYLSPQREGGKPRPYLPVAETKRRLAPVGDTTAPQWAPPRSYLLVAETKRRLAPTVGDTIAPQWAPLPLWATQLEATQRWLRDPVLRAAIPPHGQGKVVLPSPQENRHYLPPLEAARPPPPLPPNLYLTPPATPTSSSIAASSPLPLPLFPLPLPPTPSAHFHGVTTLPMWDPLVLSEDTSPPVPASVWAAAKTAALERRRELRRGSPTRSFGVFFDGGSTPVPTWRPAPQLPPASSPFHRPPRASPTSPLLDRPTSPLRYSPHPHRNRRGLPGPNADRAAAAAAAIPFQLTSMQSREEASASLREIDPARQKAMREERINRARGQGRLPPGGGKV